MLATTTIASFDGHARDRIAPNPGSALLRTRSGSGAIAMRSNAARRGFVASLDRKNGVPLVTGLILAFGILLSILSAADTDLVGPLRQRLALDAAGSRHVDFDPARGPIALPTPGGQPNFAVFDFEFVAPEPGAHYPNLMQTADGNAGFRIEANGASLNAVVADETTKLGYFGIPLAANLEPGRAYRIKLTYLDHGASRVAILDPENRWKEVAFSVKHVNIATPVFGGGFSADRAWTAPAHLRVFRSGAAPSQGAIEMAIGVVWAIGSGLLVAAILFVWAPLASRQAATAFAGLDGMRAAPKSPFGEAGDLLCVFRFLAFLAVACGHAVMLFKPTGLQDTLRDSPLAALLLGCPWAGIWMFFVLSGYLMGKGFWACRYSLDRAGLLAFFNNRLVKILPAYLAVFLFFGVLSQPEIFLKDNLFILFRVLSFNYIAPFECRPLGSFWSISTEFQFYLLAPVMTYAILRAATSGLRFALVVLALLSGGLALRYGLYSTYGIKAWSSYVYSPLYANLDLFGLGIATAAASRFVSVPKVAAAVFSWTGAALAAVTFGIAASLYAAGAVYLQTTSDDNWTMWVAPTLMALASVATIATIELGSAAGGSRMPRAVARTITLLGALTYPLYLWYEPVLRSFSRVLSVKGDLYAVVPSILASLGIVFLLAYFTYAMIEQPTARWRRPGRAAERRQPRLAVQPPPIDYRQAGSFVGPQVVYDRG